MYRCNANQTREAIINDKKRLEKVDEQFRGTTVGIEICKALDHIKEAIKLLDEAIKLLDEAIIMYRGELERSKNYE